MGQPLYDAKVTVAGTDLSLYATQAGYTERKRHENDQTMGDASDSQFKTVPEFDILIEGIQDYDAAAGPHKTIIAIFNAIDGKGTIVIAPRDEAAEANNPTMTFTDAKIVSYDPCVNAQQAGIARFSVAFTHGGTAPARAVA